MKQVGRPSEYKPELCATAYKFMSAGLSETQTIAQLDVSRATFYKWKKEHPEFKEAVERGAVKFDAQHEDLGVKGMMKAMDIDYQFWRDLGKYRNGWSEKPSTATTNTQINIDTMNVLNDMSNEELLALIKDKMSEHPELGRIIEHDSSSE